MNEPEDPSSPSSPSLEVPSSPSSLRTSRDVPKVPRSPSALRRAQFALNSRENSPRVPDTADNGEDADDGENARAEYDAENPSPKAPRRTTSFSQYPDENAFPEEPTRQARFSQRQASFSQEPHGEPPTEGKSLSQELDELSECTPRTTPSLTSFRQCNSRSSFGSFIQQKEAVSGKGKTGYVANTQTFLENSITQSVSAAFIFLTVLLLCLDTDRRAKGLPVSIWQEVVMTICFAVYLIEFLLTIFVQGCRAVSDAWFYIDLLVILTSMVDYIVNLAVGETSMLRLFRVGRMLRLGKLFRSLKLLQHTAWLKEQYIMCMMMASCFRTVLFALGLCFFVLTLWSILAVELLNDIVQDIGTRTTIFDNCERCPRSFATIWDANWTFFQTIVSGDSWGQVAIPVIEEVWWSALIFIGSLTSVVFGVLTLIPAVVIDTFATRRAKDLEAMATLMEYEEVAEKRNLQKMFNKVDEDKNGSLDLNEVCEGASKVQEFRQYLRVLDVDANDLAELFEMIDADCSGEVDSTEFIEALYRLKHTESKTATKMVQHMVRCLKDKTQNLEDRLEDKHQSLENRLDDCHNPETNSKSMEGLLNEHASRIDKLISDAITISARTTFENVMEATESRISSLTSSPTSTPTLLPDGPSCRAVVKVSNEKALPIKKRTGEIGDSLTGESNTNIITHVCGIRESSFERNQKPPQIAGLPSEESPMAEQPKGSIAVALPKFGGGATELLQDGAGAEQIEIAAGVSSENMMKSPPSQRQFPRMAVVKMSSEKTGQIDQRADRICDSLRSESNTDSTNHIYGVPDPSCKSHRTAGLPSVASPSCYPRGGPQSPSDE